LYSLTKAAGHFDQERLNDQVGKPTLRKAGIAERGQYCNRDTFTSLAISSGEDPGWVAQVCGTSEEMAFRRCRKWIPGLQVGAEKRIAALLQRARRFDASRTVLQTVPKKTLSIEK
jgi:hypothetical protein